MKTVSARKNARLSSRYATRSSQLPSAYGFGRRVGWVETGAKASATVTRLSRARCTPAAASSQPRWARSLRASR